MRRTGRFPRRSVATTAARCRLACPAGMQLTGGRCEANPDANGWCPFSTRREGDRCRGGATFPPSAELLVANALMLLNSPSVSADYAGLLKDKYAAEVFRNASLADVNGWVARKTNGKIDKILDEAKADATSAVILSAVYFKSRWATPFDERRAQAEPFYISGTEQVMVSMMHQTGHYALVARQGYRAIRLPYVIQSLALVVVLPNEIDGLNDVMRGIDAKEQSALLAAYRSDPPLARAVLTLPRFKIESDIDLVPQFRKAAMQLAFDGNRADFSGMTGSPPSSPRLVIGKIRHRATIEVAEESTEAAAVTAVEMRPGGAAAPPPGPPPEDFRVDHPFLFYLADNATGAVLFAGRVASPPQLAGPVALQTQTALPPVSVGPMQSQRPSQGATQRPAPLPPTVVAPTPKSRPQ